MIHPHKPQHATPEEDLDLELPDEDDDDEAREEEAFAPEDDDDLGLDDDDREVGLDVDTGLDDGDDEGEALDDEETSWLDDGSVEPSLREDAEGDDDDDEALTEGSEPATDQGDDWEDDLTFEESTTAVDGGEEGFGEDVSLNEVDIEGLPPLDDSLAADAEESAEDTFASELIGDIGARAEAEEAIEEVAPGLRLHRMRPERVSIETLLRLGRPLTSLVAAGDAGVGWDGSLLVADADAPRPERRFAAADAAFALAALQTEQELLVALATPAGVLCSRDSGRTFAAAAALPAREWSASAIAWTLGPRGPRLWAAPPGGPLWSSDDYGASLARTGPEAQVLRLRADGRHALIALCRREDGGASALGSSDGGQSFARLELPVREVERVQDVQTSGGVVLCSRRAPSPQLVWRMAAHDWVELAPQASAPAVLVDEDEQVSAYFFVHAGGRRLLCRRELAARAPLPQIVCELPADAGAALQLSAFPHDGMTTLQLGSERAWYRVRVRHSGDDA
jgi:hypothetical protein